MKVYQIAFDESSASKELNVLPKTVISGYIQASLRSSSIYCFTMFIFWALFIPYHMIALWKNTLEDGPSICQLDLLNCVKGQDFAKKRNITFELFFL